MNARLSIGCIIALTAFFLTDALAQFGYYQRQGDFRIVGKFSTSETSNNFGGTMGYNVTPAFTIGLDVTHIALKDLDLSANRFAPLAIFYPIQQSQNIPLSAYGQIAYFSGSFSSDELKDLGLSLSSSGLNFSFGIFTEQIVSEIFSIIPGGSVEFITAKSKLKNDIGNSISGSSTTTIFNFNAMFVLGTSENAFLYTLPGVSISEGETSLGISFGIGFRNRKPGQNSYPQKIDQELFDLEIHDPTTRLPNFRSAISTATKYTDDEILRMFRKKYPKLENKSDEQLIELIEKKYRNKIRN